MPYPSNLSPTVALFLSKQLQHPRDSFTGVSSTNLKRTKCACRMPMFTGAMNYLIQGVSFTRDSSVNLERINVHVALQYSQALWQLSCLSLSLSLFTGAMNYLIQGDSFTGDSSMNLKRTKCACSIAMFTGAVLAKLSLSLSVYRRYELPLPRR